MKKQGLRGAIRLFRFIFLTSFFLDFLPGPFVTATVSIIRPVSIIAPVLVAIGSQHAFAASKGEGEKKVEEALPMMRLDFNRGWPEIFNVVFNFPASNGSSVELLDPKKNYIWLHIRPPHEALDLRSAEKFRRSKIAKYPFQEGDKDEVGHVLLGWRCGGGKPRPDGSIDQGFSGVTGGWQKQIQTMIKGGWGLTALVTPATDGYIQTVAMINDYLEATKDEGYVSYNLIMEVPEESCVATVNFLAAFGSAPNNPQRFFSIGLDPAKGEGAGCGSYAWSALSHAQVFPEDIQEIVWRELSAPLAVMGRNLTLPKWVKPYEFKNPLAQDDKPHYVSLDTFLKGPWDGPGPHETLRLVDPELLILFVETLTQLHLESRDHFERSWYRTIHEDYRVVYSVRPQYAFPEKFVIDASFDPQANSLVEFINYWWSQEKENGLVSRLVPFQNSAALILERQKF